eukprot:SAG22_NODE_122_length_18920_cov_23.494076_15_plen_68_part_00
MSNNAVPDNAPTQMPQTRFEKPTHMPAANSAYPVRADTVSISTPQSSISPAGCTPMRVFIMMAMMIP